MRAPSTRRGAAALALALALPTLALATGGSAGAAETIIPGTMSTAAQNTSTFAVPVAPGTVPSAITGVLTQPELSPGGTVDFAVNGRPALSVPSTLYRKVTIPVSATDVIADGTIGLTMTTRAAASPGATCTSTAGTAGLRKIGLTYTGTETVPTTVGAFLPQVATALYVQIPSDAGAGVITAGLTAVAALAYKYGDDTPVSLVLKAPDPASLTAGTRIVSLVDGPEGVPPVVTADTGVPTLTLTGPGDVLDAAARALSTDSLGLSGSGAENPSQAAKPRSTATRLSLGDLGTGDVALTGYGSTTQRFEVKQDAFGGPVQSMRLHLEGAHTAFADDSGARLDVKVNGNLVGSTTLGDDSTFDLDVGVPATSLRSVNDVDLTLNANAPDGSACTPASVPAAEVDLDTSASTVSVTDGFGQTKGFQLYPQVFGGTVPLALRSADGQQARAAVNAAVVVAALQRAAAAPLEIQLTSPDVFLAGDANGIMVGARASDSETLDAPLKLSATRLLNREDSVISQPSQDPYAVAESIDRDDRLVLMLGSWAPGGAAATGDLARKVVTFLTNTGWADLDGDLVIADAANPAFATASKSLAPHREVVEEKSYAKWFIVVIAVLLLLLGLQVVAAIRRDRRVARDDDGHDGPAYVEDEEYDDPEVDDLGDVDDLDVLEHAEERDLRRPHPTEPDDRDLDAEPVDGPVDGPVDEPVEVDVPEQEPVEQPVDEPVDESTSRRGTAPGTGASPRKPRPHPPVKKKR